MAASSPLGRGVLQEAIGPALHPLLMLMYVTGAGLPGDSILLLRR